MKLLIIDNYDSFVYNIVHTIVNVANVEPTVVKNDQFSLVDVEQYDKIILSPGPGVPQQAGLMLELLKEYAAKKSILGVCLGHQAIGVSFGATLANLAQPLHGVVSEMDITKPDYLFANCPAKINIGHYHSWVVAPFDAGQIPLEVIATDNAGHIMALRHTDYDVRGVQFHPESIMTDFGQQLLTNWINQ